MRRSTLSVVLSLVLVFASGTVVGALAHRYYALNTVSAKSTPKTPEEMRQAYMTEMQSRLKLSSEQTVKLGEILDETRQKFRDLREKHRPEMRAIQDGQVERINAMLSAQQQAEYAQMRKERDAKRKAESK